MTLQTVILGKGRDNSAPRWLGGPQLAAALRAPSSEARGRPVPAGAAAAIP